MFLIKLHIEISILILITAIGFLILGKEQIKKNGWVDLIDTNKKKDIRVFLIFFVPISNILMLLLIFVTIFKTREEIENMMEENEKDG